MPDSFVKIIMTEIIEAAYAIYNPKEAAEYIGEKLFQISLQIGQSWNLLKFRDVSIEYNNLLIYSELLKKYILFGSNIDLLLKKYSLTPTGSPHSLIRDLPEKTKETLIEKIANDIGIKKTIFWYDDLLGDRYSNDVIISSFEFHYDNISYNTKQALYTLASNILNRYEKQFLSKLPEQQETYENSNVFFRSYSNGSKIKFEDNYIWYRPQIGSWQRLGTINDVDAFLYDISGKIQDESGGPISNVTVELFGPDFSSSVPTKTVYTDDNGNFFITEVKAEGDYYIIVKKINYQTYYGTNKVFNITQSCYHDFDNITIYNVFQSFPLKAIYKKPDNLSTNNSLNTQISWSNGGNTTSFKIYFGTNSPDNIEYIKEQSNTYYNPEGLLNETTYYWRVDSVNQDGITKGNIWRFKTKSKFINKPSKVYNASPQNYAYGKPININLKWEDDGRATSFKIYFGTDPTPDSSEYKTEQSGIRYDPGVLAYNTNYYWRIDTINNDGMTKGNVWQFSTASEDTEQLSKPQTPYPSNGSKGVGINIKPSWSESTGAVSYIVYFGIDSTPDVSEFKGENLTTIYETDMLKFNTTYYWRVDARNSDEIIKGDVWHFTTGSSEQGTVNDDTQRPYLTVSNPPSGKTLIINKPVEITFSAKDNVSVSNIKIEFNNDDNTDNYIIVKNNISPSVNKYIWTPDIETNNGRIRITAYDEAGNYMRRSLALKIIAQETNTGDSSPDKPYV